MTSLLDIHAFRRLGRVCNQHDLDVSLFGGAVTRLARTVGDNDLTPTALNDVDSLFVLAPPFSGFDISHSGRPIHNDLIRRAILDLVPNSECFRWNICSQSEWAFYDEAAHYNNLIPARWMSLSTNPEVGLQDPLNGRTDIKARSYRYERNSAYERSPLFLQNRDLELFSALIYLITVFEDQSRQLRLDQPGFNAVAKVLGDACKLETIVALQESSYLRSRFHHLIAVFSTLDAPKDLLEQVRLPQLMQFIKDYFPSFGGRLQEMQDAATQEGTAVISSARIGGDIFRLPVVSKLWLHGQEARNAFFSTLNGNVTLGDNENVIVASPWMELARGIAASRTPCRVKDRARKGQEFLYINLRNQNRFLTSSGPVCLDGSLEFREEDLAVFLAVRTSAHKQSNIFPLVGDVSLKLERMLIRTNAWAIFEELSRTDQPEVRIFISGWNS